MQMSASHSPVFIIYFSPIIVPGTILSTMFVFFLLFFFRSLFAGSAAETATAASAEIDDAETDKQCRDHNLRVNKQPFHKLREI